MFRAGVISFGICSKYILWLAELQNLYCIYGTQLNFVH